MSSEPFEFLEVCKFFSNYILWVAGRQSNDKSLDESNAALFESMMPRVAVADFSVPCLPISFI